MNKRQFKKLEAYARRLWLSYKVTSVERGYLSEYFHMNPYDWKIVRKFLKGKWLLSKLKDDYRKLYHHPGYSEEKFDEFLTKIKCGDFLPPYNMDSDGRLILRRYADCIHKFRR